MMYGGEKKSWPIPGPLQYPTLNRGTFNSGAFHLYRVIFFLENETQ